LLLLISVAAKPRWLRPVAGAGMNSTTETSAGTALDYSTMFPANCKDCRHTMFAILLSQWMAKRKEESVRFEHQELASDGIRYGESLDTGMARRAHQKKPSAD
jgi:hypothetical protein